MYINEVTEIHQAKIAFQQDADRPRIDRVSQHALCRRVCTWGVYLVLGGCLLQGGVAGPGGV